MTAYALLGSPFLGPEIWAPVAGELTAAGNDVTVVPGRGDTAEAVAVALLEGLPPDEQVVLVPHSNAGLYVPALAASRPVGGVVFVDAALPGPGRTTPVAPAELAESLAERVDEAGVLPPWTEWWPAEEVSGLLPDEATRATVVEGQPRVPASYLSGRVATPPGWETGLRAAYLAFGDGYALEVALAREWEWPVRVLPGGHLHLLVDPQGVAAAVATLAAEALAEGDQRRD